MSSAHDEIAAGSRPAKAKASEAHRKRDVQDGWFAACRAAAEAPASESITLSFVSAKDGVTHERTLSATADQLSTVERFFCEEAKAARVVAPQLMFVKIGNKIVTTMQQLQDSSKAPSQEILEYDPDQAVDLARTSSTTKHEAEAAKAATGTGSTSPAALQAGKALQAKQAISAEGRGATTSALEVAAGTARQTEKAISGEAQSVLKMAAEAASQAEKAISGEAQSVLKMAAEAASQAEKAISAAQSAIKMAAEAASQAEKAPGAGGSGSSAPERCMVADGDAQAAGAVVRLGTEQVQSALASAAQAEAEAAAGQQAGGGAGGEGTPQAAVGAHGYVWREDEVEPLSFTPNWTEDNRNESARASASATPEQPEVEGEQGFVGEALPAEDGQGEGSSGAAGIGQEEGEDEQMAAGMHGMAGQVVAEAAAQVLHQQGGAAAIGQEDRWETVSDLLDFTISAPSAKVTGSQTDAKRRSEEDVDQEVQQEVAGEESAKGSTEAQAAGVEADDLEEAGQEGGDGMGGGDGGSDGEEEGGEGGGLELASECGGKESEGVEAGGGTGGSNEEEEAVEEDGLQPDGEDSEEAEEVEADGGSGGSNGEEEDGEAGELALGGGLAGNRAGPGHGGEQDVEELQAEEQQAQQQQQQQQQQQVQQQVQQEQQELLDETVSARELRLRRRRARMNG